MSSHDTARRIGTETSKTRAALLDAAERLMLEEGYAAVTSRRVAAQRRPEAPARPLLLPHHGRPVPGALPAAGRAGLERQAQALASPQPLWALWDLSRDPRGTALTMEFVALANHRKAIRAEIAASAERFRAELLAGARVGARRATGSTSGAVRPSSAPCCMTERLAILVIEEETLGMSTGHAETVAFVEELLAGSRGPSAGARAPRT